MLNFIRRPKTEEIQSDFPTQNIEHNTLVPELAPRDQSPESSAEEQKSSNDNVVSTKTTDETRPPKQKGVALALGGGVARGWAHIGALRAMDEIGIPISMIAGTSIGALVGGCYLAGKLDELEEFARSLTRSNMLRYMDFTLRATGLITGDRLALKMNEHMEGINIEELPKPFVAVATDLHNGHEIWLHDGPLVPAVRASYALPGVFTPVEHNGRLLVDGAVVNPIPVSACRMHEANVVIAVNLNSEVFGRATVIRTSHYDTAQLEIAAEETANSSWIPFFSNKSTNSQKQSQMGVTGVMVDAYHIIQDRIARARLAGDPPDYTIRPQLKDIGISEFHRADEAIKIGYDEMMYRARELENQGALALL